MIIAQRLLQLQETEVEIEFAQKTLDNCLDKLGDSEKLISARAKLILIQKKLEELKKQQKEIEWIIEDINTKLRKSNDDLYSGRIKNPKELTNLQQEARTMESQCNKHEEKALEIMSLVETVTGELSAQQIYLQATEAESIIEQTGLSENIGQLKKKITELNHQRQLVMNEIEPQSLEYYYQIKTQKGLAVAKIEQGMCRGCRISLSSAELQKARTRQLVECSNCHRILCIA